MSGCVRPSGHLQVVDRGGGRRWHALWRDADGRPDRALQEAADCRRAFVDQHLDVGHARAVIDEDVDELPAGAA
jgi:hypothetical protein